MSTPPPPPPGFSPPPSKGSGFPWLACGIGCAVVAVLVVGVGGFIAFKAKQAFDRMQASVEKMEEAGRRQRAARERILALDETRPPSWGEELSQAELTDADLSQLLELHAALAGPLAEHAEVSEGLRAFEEKLESLDGSEEPSFREVIGMMSGMKDALAAEFRQQETLVELLETAADVMEERGIGRAKLRDLLAIVELRFLGREGFEELALPAADWAALESARAQVTLWGDDEYDPEQWTADEWTDFQAELAEHRATVERLEARIAETPRELAAGTRARLESRRAELEAISTADALAMVELTRKEAAFDAWAFDPAEAAEAFPEDGSQD